MKLHLPHALLSAIVAFFATQAQAQVSSNDAYYTVIYDGEEYHYPIYDDGIHVNLITPEHPEQIRYWSRYNDSYPIVFGVLTNVGITWTGIYSPRAPMVSFYGGSRGIPGDGVHNLSFTNSTSSFFSDIEGCVFSRLDSLTYSDNNISSGIRGYSNGIEISYNGHIRFDNNDYSNSSYSLLEGSTITIMENSSLTFSNNDRWSSSWLLQPDAALIGSSGATTITTSGKISFTDNTDKGGQALISTGLFRLTGNDSVEFFRNTAKHDLISATSLNISDNEGGVTFEGNSGSIYLSASGTQSSICNNGHVLFSGNDIGMSGNSDLEVSGNVGLTLKDNTTTGSSGVLGGANVLIADNNTLSMTGNTGKSSGIHGNGTVTVTGHDKVDMTGNSTQYIVYGAKGISMSGNDSLNISNNSSTYGLYGGPSSGSGISICNNGDVIFDNNDCTSDAYGLIYSGAAVSISDNTSLTISGNDRRLYSSGSSSLIVGSSVSITNNDKVNIDNNICSNGKLINAGSVNVNNNGLVSFSGNRGAGNSGMFNGISELSIEGNDSVKFEKNAVKSSSTWRLRSIYNSSSGSALKLAAANGGDITFYDSVYQAGSTTLNGKYTDEDGTMQTAGGDIVFSGLYTEEHLRELKGSEGTSTEISNSRTSELKGATSLEGGRLRVEESAVLKTTGGLSVSDGSGATVKVSNATLTAGTATISIGTSGTLQLTEGAILEAGSTTIADGATLAVSATDIAQAAALTLDDVAPITDTFNANVGATIDGNLTLEAGSSLVCDSGHISMTRGSVLSFMATSDEKINLVLTMGTEYSADSQVLLFSDADVVKFFLDGEEISVDDTNTLLANRIFSGSRINDETTLNYDSNTGVVYLQGVSNVVPEPATATLSLLALAALAARRRRK